MARAILIWTALGVAMTLPAVIAMTSPLLAWRSAVYIGAGLAGVVAMALLLVQPLLAGRYLPGLTPLQSRRWHGWVGTGLVAAVILHVLGLWLTSAPDVIDALLFRSPTPFSDWGVIAMWAVFAAALLAAFRKRLGLRPQLWRLCHMTLVVVVAAASVAHAVLIEGTMETVSKILLCALVLAAITRALVDLKPWTALTRRKG